MRRIFIGDIQGCRAELEALLTRIRVRPSDRLYCVGDLVNRGPDSLGVLRLLRDLRVRVVLGNHDLHLLRVAHGHGHEPKALRAVIKARDGDALLRWLATQPVMRLETDLVAVHAGIHPRWRNLETMADAVNASVAPYVRGATDDAIEFATQVRYCNANGDRPARDYPPPGRPYRPWDAWYRGDRRVVFGHWARRGLVLGDRVRGLDTGCVYGGTLTAWIAEEDRFVHVPGWDGR